MRSTTGTKVSGAVLTLFALAATTGCGGQTDSGTKATAKTSVQASPTGPVTPTANLLTCEGDEFFQSDPKAIREFGRDNMTAAFCEMADFTMTSTYTPLMVHDTKYEVAQFDFVKPWMTPELAKRWDKIVANWVATNDEDVRGNGGPKDLVRQLVWADLAPHTDKRGTFTWAPKGVPVTENFKVSNGTTQPKAYLFKSADGKAKKIVLQISIVGTINMGGPGGKIYKNDGLKRIVYTLVKNNDADKPWLIENFRGGHTITAIPHELAK